MRVVQACDTPSCERESHFEITDRGKHLAWHCDECIGIIESILDDTSRMVRAGTPTGVAADWAAGACRRRLETR